jgi:hypothetical protein
VRNGEAERPSSVTAARAKGEAAGKGVASGKAPRSQGGADDKEEEEEEEKEEVVVVEKEEESPPTCTFALRRATT